MIISLWSEMTPDERQIQDASLRSQGYYVIEQGANVAAAIQTDFNSDVSPNYIAGSEVPQPGGPPVTQNPATFPQPLTYDQSWIGQATNAVTSVFSAVASSQKYLLIGGMVLLTFIVIRQRRA